MSIPSILRRKNPGVISVAPGDTIATAVSVLGERRIGAVLVCDGDEIHGILSERDVVRSLATKGAATLTLTAADLMTAVLYTITPDTTIQRAMEVMTEGRVRHLPVMSDGKLAGLVSIGDVVKERLDQQAGEVDALRDYVAGQG